MKKRIVTAGVIAAAMLGGEAQAGQVSTAESAAKSVQRGYVDAQREPLGNTDEAKTTCRRVSREKVDCKSSILFWERQVGWENPDFPFWNGIRVSWTIRVWFVPKSRRVTVGRSRILYFPKDPGAPIDPEDPDFGGKALIRKQEQGD